MSAVTGRIGFIGIGNQGGPIARRIVDAGHDLTLWARRAESLEPFADTPASRAETIAALGAACDIVGLCVLADADVIDVAGQLLPAMRPDTVVLIHSTVHPQVCRDLAAAGEARGIAVLDAPVSGGNARARTGELAVMVGGDSGAYERVLPILRTFATTIERVGECGAGQLCKLVNNALATVNFATGLAFLDAGAGLGLDRAALARMMLAGSAQSFGLAQMARATPEGLRFARPLLEKDVGLMLDVLAQHGLADAEAARFARHGIAAFAQSAAAE